MQTTGCETRRSALVVDYDPWDRSFTTQVLAEQGYVVVDASNGASGLRLAEKHRSDIILLDLSLPELSGPEFLRQLKTKDITREIPVILLGSEPCGETCAAEGCVPKPLEEMRLMTEVGRVLARPRGIPSYRAGRPFVLVASTDAAVADRLVEHVRRAGSAACAARSEAGCLRVATAVGPDVIMLDSNIPPHLEGLLRAHPVSRAANIVRLPEQLRTLWTE